MTSPNAANELFARLAAGGRDARALAGARIASIGPGTTDALARHGIAADIVPERFVAEGLVEALADVPVTRALVARARGRARAARRAARRAEPRWTCSTCMKPSSSRSPPRRSRWRGRPTTSPSRPASTVRNFLGAAGEGAGGGALSAQTRIVSIGPVTSETLREHGLKVDVEAAEHDIDGLLQALLADAAAR